MISGTIARPEEAMKVRMEASVDVDHTCARAAYMAKRRLPGCL
jgi:hypothetical protein